ncbi:hypothetical protein EXIGLDRAFT_749137 [Exidia glandulosa HHB12029]|uniref:F-box domain-containing protein n=1 Tax=Exidia glandulosa HHB12029 TaxID=1314781 RepID=A0A165IK00_EXIGL|nr:hypothetical protein EXIGLDRAFT_749137 [Exidia glandulosa HHB12029]
MGCAPPRDDGLRPVKRQRIEPDGAHDGDDALSARSVPRRSLAQPPTHHRHRHLPHDVIRHLVHVAVIRTHYNAQVIRTLSSICSTWRFVTLEARQIWATIIFSYNRIGDDADGPRHFLTTVRDVQEWLERSGTCSKNVSLDCHRMPWEKLQALFLLLRQHAQYIRSFSTHHLPVSGMDPRALLVDNLLNFARLSSINMREHIGLGILDQDSRNIVLDRAPQVKSIAFDTVLDVERLEHGVRQRLDGLSLPSGDLYDVMWLLHFFGLPSLKSLAIGALHVTDDAEYTVCPVKSRTTSDADWTHGWDIDRTNGGLRYFEADSYEARVEDQRALTPFEAKELRKLYLGVRHTIYNAASDTGWAPLFRLLVAPNLEELALRDIEIDPFMIWNLSPVQNMIMTYRPPLRRLYLEGFSFDGIDLLEFLGCLPLLERLVILATRVSSAELCDLLATPQHDRDGARWLCPRLTELCIVHHPDYASHGQQVSRTAIEELARVRLAEHSLSSMLEIRLDRATLFQEGRAFYWVEDPAYADVRLSLFTDALQPTAWWQVCTGAESLL